MRACRSRVLAADLSVLDVLNAQISQAERRLAEVLPDTPAGVLVSLPGVGVVRASNYGAALGDPARFGNADQAYRSGLVPASYESAGRAAAARASTEEATPSSATPSSSSAAGSPNATASSPATAPAWPAG